MEDLISQITIIVPVHNAECYLKRCIDSILAQTYTAFICILIDDGSTDTSPKICDEYAQKDNRIKVLHCPNGGPSYARNQGLNIVNTKWVTFIDSDDFVNPQFIENFFKYKNNEITTQIIQGYHCLGLEGEDSNTLYPGTAYVYNEVCEGKRSVYFEENNILYNWAVWSKLFSVEIIKKKQLKFEESIWCGEDGLFWHKYLCYIKKIIFIPERGYTYYCPQNFESVSRDGKHQLSVHEWMILAGNYKEISKVLSKKFKLGRKCSAWLQMFYLNNYFKILLKSDNLTAQQIEYLKKIRPPKNLIIWSFRGLVYFIFNFFPIMFIRKINLLKHK